MKRSKRVRLAPKGSTRNSNENRKTSDLHNVGEVELALSLGGTVATPSNGGANGTDHWI